MQKRYRYGNPTSQSALQRARPYILLFAGWNLIAAVVWKFANSRAEKKDPDWFSRSGVDRIARLTGSIPANTKTYTYSLGKSEKNDDNSKSSEL